MNKVQQIFNEIKPVWDVYQPNMDHISQMPERGVRDVLDRDSWGYYQFLACLMKVKKPKQVVELGGAMGVACVAMLSEIPKDSTLYSITLPENGLEFSFIIKKYKNLKKVLGDDLDLKKWPEGTVLDDTDIWFLDSLHTEKQLRAELELYKPFFKEGAILLLDDIKMPELWPVWLDLPYEKLNISFLHVPSGFGMAVV